MVVAGPIDDWPNARRPNSRPISTSRPILATGGREEWPESVTGDRRDEVGDLFGFPAQVEPSGHLPQAAGPPFADRIQHERPAPGRSGDVDPHAHVEVGPDAANRLDG